MAVSPPPLLLLLLLLVLALLLKSDGAPVTVASTDITTLWRLGQPVGASPPNPQPAPKASTLRPTGSSATLHPSTHHSQTDPSSSSRGESAIAHLSTTSSGDTSVYFSPPGSRAGSTLGSPLSPETVPTSLQPERISHHSSGPPVLSSSPPPTAATPRNTSMTLPWGPTPLSTQTEPSSTTSVTTSQTASASGPTPGGPRAPELQRNPGVVVAVCLLVSVLVIGSVVMAVRCCQKKESKFRKLDEVSMGVLSERSSFAYPLPK
ncbi:uncharacterized LOC729966 homolog [Echinops telfairi]|uniref:Uncharacterized LOC729966 homolog n=1 Tax=Echinops telfairi TaxID=9371 RepID=A0AC55DTV3_ECHTE|nr:uncharacterized LOC729966 homolog [Echinops telfairi]